MMIDIKARLFLYFRLLSIGVIRYRFSRSFQFLLNHVILDIRAEIMGAGMLHRNMCNERNYFFPFVRMTRRGVRNN